MIDIPSPSPDESDPTHLHREGVGATGTDRRDDGEDSNEVLQTILFTDIENSVNLTGTLGKKRYAEVLTRHGELFYEALGTVRAIKIENTGDGFMARFERAADAVGVALRFQRLLRRAEWGMEHPLLVRVGIHQGRILLMAPVREMPEMVGEAVSLAARVMGMADGGQVLLTREVFDEARQSIEAIHEVPAEEQAALGWRAHGAYLVKGIEGPVEVFEVGEDGYAPFRKPRNGPDAQRSVSAEEEKTLGWRPAAGLEVPGRTGWNLVRSLGKGGFGEVWLAENPVACEARVFKFCFDVVRLRSFKREVMMFQLIRQALGPRHDIATLYEVQLETTPFFLESAYCGGGRLDDWLLQNMHDGKMPLAARLKIVADVARALAAAHSVGIIHKDVKPSNIFIEELPGGTVQPRLADFGIGELTDSSAIEGLELGFTGAMTMTASQTRSGTQMYSAPEYMVGRPPSILGDIYSLGVVLYQVVIADFQRPIGTGWERDVPDALLAGDIAACVDIEPDRRLTSAALVAERLETLEQRRAEQAGKEAAARRERELEEKVLAQRKKFRLTVIGAVLATVAIVVAMLLRDSHNEALAQAKSIAARLGIEHDQRYREDMTAAISDIDKWRGESARALIELHAHPYAGEHDRRGWEWWFANSVLSPKHDSRHVSAQPLRALAISPDEKNAAVAGDDGDVTIWSCDTLEKTDSWHVGAVRSLAWKGGTLAIGLASGEVVLREVAAKRDRRRWQAHAGAVTTLAWDPVHDELTTGGANGVIAWWQGDGTPLKTMTKRGPVLSLDWQADGRQIAVVYGNPTRLFAGPPNELEREHAYPMETPESVVAWRPGANEVAISMRDKPMRSFDPYRADDSFSLSSHFSPGASAFAWSPDGMRVAVGGIDGKILVVGRQNSKEIHPSLYGHTHRVAALHWLGRERLLSIGDDGTLRAWDDLQRPAHTFATTFSAPPTAAQWHPHDPLLAVLIAGDEVQVLDASGHVKWMRPMPPPTQGHLPLAAGRLAWSPDGQWLAVACEGRGLVAWHTADGGRFLPEGLDDAADVQWLGDSRAMLVRTVRGWVQVAPGGEPSAPITDEHVMWLGDLGGRLLAEVSVIGDTIRFSVAHPGSAPSVDVMLPKELGTVHTCALSPDRTQLAIAGETGALLWLDTRTGKVSQPSTLHASAIQALGWYLDGSRLVTASSDGTCRLFNVAQAAQTCVLEHQLDPEIVAAGWSADGRRLMLASAPSRTVRVYEVVESSDRAAMPRAAPLLAAIDEHPDEESGWNALAQALLTSKDEHAPVLRAAAELGLQARFSPLAGARLADVSPTTEWEGVALPRVLQVAQACALERWDEVVALANGTADAGVVSWLALAKAEALAHLERKKESEAANLKAWQALRHLQGARDPTATAFPLEGGSSTIDLAPWATAHPEDDWVTEDTAGNENNNLRELRPVLDPQPDGVEFRTGDFILLGGKTMRLTTGRMLPRSTGWIPLHTASNKISCVLAACNVIKPEDFDGTCLGSIFLLRKEGGAVRIPLVFGRNIWRWWAPRVRQPFDAPPSAVAWQGANPRASYFKHDLLLYRLNWTAEAGESPVVAISMVSAMRQPAPLLMSIDARP